MKNMSRGRIAWVDDAKGLGVVLVLVLHSVFPEPMRAVASAFAMMLFFWLSGFVFSVKSYDSFQEFIVKKIRSLIVPGIVCAWIVCFCKTLVTVYQGAEFSPSFLIWGIFGVFINLRGNPIWSGVTWFLPCIFLIEICAYPCMRYCESTLDSCSEKNNAAKSLFIIVLLLVFGFVYGNFIHKALPWSADIAVEMSAFFCLGMVCRRYGVFDGWSRWWICVPAFGVLVVSSMLNYFLFGGVNPYLTHYGELILFCISAISGIVMSVSMVQILRKYFPYSFIVRLLNYCGNNSIIFYLVNVSTYAYIPNLISSFGWLKLDILDFTPSNFIQTLVGTVFPFITSHWWYPTSYILFLLIFPWLTEGLRQFGKKKHGLLVLLLCSLQGIFPWSIIRLNIGYNITLFVYLYVLLSFFRWYTPEILVNTNVARILISIGFLFGVFTVIGIQILKPNAQNRVWLNCPSCFPSLFIAFGLLVYANKNNQFYSRIINKLASATLGVYLILTSEGVADGLSYLQHEILDGTGLLRICIISLFAVIFFCFGLCFDLVRQLIFSAFFDGNKGRVFFESLGCFYKQYFGYESCEIFRGVKLL